MRIKAVICARTFRQSLLLSSALMSLAAMPAYAQEKPKSDEQSGVILNPIVITSAPQSTPFKVVTDPKAPRQPVPASDGADYLKTIPGFSTIRNGGTNGDLVFRGMFGSRINIRTDGGVILGACGGRMDNPTSYISPESYDRMSVIKGPQTVQWGPAGSAATVLFERDPQHFDKLTLKGDSSILFGSNGRFDARVDATVGDKPGYIRMMANKSHANDYKDGDGNRVPSKWDKWNTDLYLGLTPDADTVLEISGGLGDGEARYAGRAMDGSQFERQSFGLKFSKSNVSDYLEKIEAQLYYNYADHIMDNFRLRPPQKMPMESEVDRRSMGGRVSTTWNFDEHTLVAGLDFQTDTHRNKEKVNMQLTDNWLKDAQFANYGVFGEWTWNFADNQRLVAGGRIDRASVEDDRASSLTYGDKRNQAAFSGFIRHEQDWSSLPVNSYIGLGYVNRFPDYWELFSPKGVTGSALNAFEGIESEKTVQVDLGAQYSEGDTDIWASGYLGVINDFILFDYSNPGGSVATNVNARIMGAELGVSRQFANYWKAEASIAYAWGQNTTYDEPLPQIPPLEGRLGLTYERDNWSVGALWRLVAAQTRIAENMGNVVGKDFDKSAGFGVFSVNGTYRFNESVRLSLGVDNLFNKEYTEHLNRDGDAGFGFSSNYQLREPGRTFWAKTDFKF
ncbi:TonB-dependent copper receptor [Brucella sp. B13-0095]|uniref:TonB-dependent copper receptor n=1 Tax=Brucella sp. B13-0095 TaxID=1867845 RepID=UPI00084FB509|nr:TonB-dependent copper receptor [Brucella sp. B13-0095]OEI82842.1 TonB-dependent copper receptor [Brucella sp. B13-0095]